MKLRLTKPQKEFVNSMAKYPAIVGGLGSGKTQGGVGYSLKCLAQFAQHEQLAYYMPTFDLLKRRAIPAFIEELNRLGIGHYEVKSDRMIVMPGLGSVLFRSYDRPESIVSYEVSHSIVDEIDTLDREKAAEVWRKIAERNRGRTSHPSGNTIAAVTTPDQGYSGFVYSRWGKNPDDKYHITNAPTFTNVFLPDRRGYINQIVENYDPLLAEMYLLGMFVPLSRNKVYHCFNPIKHHTDRELKPDDSLLRISIDFNIGGCCATVSVEEGKVTHVVKEFVSQDTRDFVIRLDKDYRKQGRRIVIYPDASGKSESTNASASDLDIIRQGGYRVDAPEANPFIRDRVHSVNGGFANNKILVNTRTCPQLTDSFEMQGYDKKGKPEKFEDHPSIDDWTDSFGYYYHRKNPLARTRLATNLGYN